jgi:hypothetical protein
MGVWKTLRRPKCIGMYIEDGILYTHRSRMDPDFMLQQTAQEQAVFLRPVPHELAGARAKFEAIKGAPTAAVGVAVGPVMPFVPVGGKKTFLITVILGNGQQLIGWSRNGKQALRFWKSIQKGAKKAARADFSTPDRR